MTDARTLTTTLGGRWYGRYGTAACPVCQPERRKDQNGLTLSDGHAGLLVNCKKSECAFRDILAAAGVHAGAYRPPEKTKRIRRQDEQQLHIRHASKQARRLWDGARPIAGTVAERYLRVARGITCPLPQVLRFHASCWHGPTKQAYPALIAAVQGADLAAVHRTYLRLDGSGKADIEPAKAMLGATAGGCVRLTEGHGPLVVAEGIETALSLASGLVSKPLTLWAALSTSGIRGLRLPDQPGRLTIAPDGDRPGREAATALAARAHALGWQVSLLPAPDGLDWNDILNTNGEAA